MVAPADDAQKIPVTEIKKCGSVISMARPHKRNSAR
jgi:hypothetical protein